MHPTFYLFSEEKNTWLLSMYKSFIFNKRYNIYIKLRRGRFEHEVSGVRINAINQLSYKPLVSISHFSIQIEF